MKAEFSQENEHAINELKRGDWLMFPDYKYEHEEEDRTIPRRMILLKFQFMEMYARDTSRIILASMGTVFLHPVSGDYPPLVTFDESGSPFYCEKTDFGLGVSFFRDRSTIINRGEINIGLDRILEALESIPQYAPHAASLRVVHGI